MILQTNRNQLCEHCHISEWEVKHHISYFPEIIIKLCKKCHNIIHKSKSPENDDLKKYDKDDSRFFYRYTPKGLVKEDKKKVAEEKLAKREAEKKAKKEAKKAETKKKADAKKKASSPKKYWDGCSWRKYF